ncbi:uncharacterized protein LOC143274858 [Babylonia areolata]|uniref:uncharacterized protein LOC143274858 n=1 Tax=Babylonia areolata TaxID=304850 RepID=UPI003FD16F4C
MSAIKKALRSTISRRRYSMFEQKENDYINTPRSKRAASEEPENETRRNLASANGSVPSRRHSAIFRRGSQMRRSMRDAVGTIRQKFKTSTRRLKPLQESQTSTPTRSSARKNGREVGMYSPFRIETPGRTTGKVARRSNIRTVASLETPTRLRREVEALTANMQALSALTPNTLHTNRSARRSPPITNGSLKTPRSARRRLPTGANPV